MNLNLNLNLNGEQTRAEKSICRKRLSIMQLWNRRQLSSRQQTMAAPFCFYGGSWPYWAGNTSVDFNVQCHILFNLLLSKPIVIGSEASSALSKGICFRKDLLPNQNRTFCIHYLITHQHSKNVFVKYKHSCTFRPVLWLCVAGLVTHRKINNIP